MEKIANGMESVKSKAFGAADAMTDDLQQLREDVAALKRSVSSLGSTLLKSVGSVTADLRENAGQIGKDAQHYAGKAAKYARKNPAYVALGLAAVGLLIYASMRNDE